MNIQVIIIDNKRICINGIGTFYFEQGIPISITISKLIEKGIEVNYYKLVDEMLKADINHERIYPLISEAISELIEIDLSERIKIRKQVNLFLVSDYETQRELIFNSLFNSTDTAMDWMRNGFERTN